MNAAIFLYLLAALILFGLFLWAVRPPSPQPAEPEEIFRRLSDERHYCRLPQILQSLQPEDFDYLRSTGRGHLVARLRNDRKRIALRYLTLLQQEFESLLQAAALLATMAPGLAPMQEWERLKLSARFALFAHYLSWRLRLDLAPQDAFGSLSEMASNLALHLETATSRIGEGAALPSESFSNQRGRDSL